MKTIKHLFLFLLLSTPLFLTQSCVVDPCSSIECQNGGTCDDGTCMCPEGYTGFSCETEVRASFLGDYSATEDCGDTPYAFDTQILAGTGITEVEFYFAPGVKITGTASGNTVTFAQQQVGSFQIEGNGTLAGTVFTMNLDYLDSSGYSYTCTYVCNKK